jgi:hypothetical protein
MSWAYARQVIRDILKETKGNSVAAARALDARAMTDARLLQELAAPHMKGIVSHAVSRVLHELAHPDTPDQHPDEAQALNMPLDAFGRDLLGALSGRNTPRFGQEDAAPQIPHKSASKAHIETIKRIAKTPIQ